jgi:hypothetical protein
VKEINFGDYTNRCRRCSDYMSTFTPDGKSCVFCDGIDNCDKCYFDLGDGWTTLDRDFWPLDENIAPLKCALCNNGYMMSADELTCNLGTITVENCLSMNGAGLCTKCEIGYSLDEDGECQ